MIDDDTTNSELGVVSSFGVRERSNFIFVITIWKGMMKKKVVVFYSLAHPSTTEYLLRFLKSFKTTD